MKYLYLVIAGFAYAQSGVKFTPSGAIANGTCGPDKKCPGKLCCSEHGFCGSTEEYCGKGCQSLFGYCPENPKPKISNTQCGPLFDFQVCGEELACSQYGWCGSSKDYTGVGCQPEYSSLSCDDDKYDDSKPKESNPEEPKTQPATQSVSIQSEEASKPKENPAPQNPPPAPRPNPPAPNPPSGGRPGRLTWYQFHGVGGMCQGRAYPDDAIVCAMHTDIRQCLRNIRITVTATGRSVTCFVVDECDRNHGCQPGTIDGTPGVWRALGLNLDLGVSAITWEFV
jgi:hypothetical protein